MTKKSSFIHNHVDAYTRCLELQGIISCTSATDLGCAYPLFKARSQDTLDTRAKEPAVIQVTTLGLMELHWFLPMITSHGMPDTH